MPGLARALLDANVLYSNHLRNLLLQMAQNDLFEVKWSGQIEREWLRNLVAHIKEGVEARTIPLIRTAFPDALVGNFDPKRIIGMTHARDRHVASAAIAVAPCVLVTNNFRHFDAAALNTFGVALRTPDGFLTELFDSKPDIVDAATREAAANLTKTLPSWDEYLTILAVRCGLQTFAARLRSFEPDSSSAAPAT
jgi:hypothetical protein